MSNKLFDKVHGFVLSPGVKSFFEYLRRVMLNRWPLKLGCFFLSLVLWGVLISTDANITREKTISNVTVNAINADALQRNGLIVVSGLENLTDIQMKVDVPQRVYNTVTAANYNVRVDLSRITAPGEQQLSILTSPSTSYGQVIWLSKETVTVVVEELITKRRVPVQLNTTGEAPAGFYAPPSASKHDPSWVVITGPRSITEDIEKCIAVFDLSRLQAQPGLQVTSVPFDVYNTSGEVVSSPLINVISESISVDSLIVEQRLYPMKTVDIDLTGITTGSPMEGYYVAGIAATPPYLSVAGTSDFLRTLMHLEVSSKIDIEGASDELIRQIVVERPKNAEYVSDEAVYVKITILPEGSGLPAAPVGIAP